ncbi:MAG: ATP-dependent zinc metalloprotease FtsH [Sutterella sp.]|nr:ATP-dependent zinc metalloprotease FtsH [Sutterella sp.]
MMQRLAVWCLIAFVLFTVFRQFSGERTVAGNLDQTSYTQFMDDAKAGKIRRVDVQGRRITVTPAEGATYTITSPGDLWMVEDLRKNGVQVYGKPDEEPSFIEQLLISWFPMILLIGVWIFFMRQMQMGGKNGGPFSFGKSKARMLDDSANKVRFSDVAGCDEAKEDVQEVVDFLKDPSKFQRLGGHIPRGILLVGSPGTGKTLLAKAIAGEAGVPFFSISGSDFVEMFVGVGASRVRDMFETAKKNAPCIIFIDEIDAVGRQRGAGLGGGNDEREQTLNQMLVEMDGFETGTNVIVVAATNRPDVLDPALMRPGRFDRQVVVPLPDIRGREQILAVHMKKIPLGADVQTDVLARGTPGFSGADLANLVNEAALFAARRNGRVVEMHDFELAKDKIMMGAERKSMVMTEDERRNTAYHESGHALVAKLMPKSDPVHKVTIVPRGRALGLTMQLPETDRYAYDKQYLLTRIAILFGGRIAEEVFMHQMTTGASNDFERATQLARDMVMRFGMSDKMGVMVYAENEGEVFLGRAVTKTTHISEKTMQAVDTEIRRILEEQYGVARKLIEEHRDKIEKMASALLKWETLDAEQLDDIMAGKDPREPKPPESKDARKLAESQDKAPTQAKEGDSVKVSSEEKESGDKAPKETASESAPSAPARDESKESTPEDSVKKSRKRTVKKDASAE